MERRVLSRILIYGIVAITIYFFISNDSSDTKDKFTQLVQYESVKDISGSQIASRFTCPSGYERLSDISDFAKFLRSSPLKEDKASVRFYTGKEKPNNVHEAVLDYDVGTRNLQQCADAVMRLRAEYLYKTGKQDDIHFNFTNGFKVEYSKYRDGHRMNVKGNKTNWYKSTDYDDSYPTFRKYMDLIFMYAGTLSLEKELKKVTLSDMQIGDVLIQGGSPGHAVIVMDMCENAQGEKLFMLTQSYMPAQDIHILKNQRESSISPWYRLNIEAEEISTPEWLFRRDDLHRF